jgi:hypothetical protein
MDALGNEQLANYMECLKSEFRELETCLQKGTTVRQLCITSKRVVLAAAQLDEMILRCLTSRKQVQRPSGSEGIEAVKKVGGGHESATNQVS